MLKVTFPHIGNSYIPLRALLMELGVEPIIPPFISQRTIALGTKLAPEFACLPLKVNLGNYIEAIEAGAECILMAGGIGPCRFGFYGEVQKQILLEAGYHPEFLTLEAPKTHPQELWQKIQHFFPRHTILDLTRAIYKAWHKAAALDEFDRLANKIRPLEQWPGATTRLQNQFYRSIDQAFLIEKVKLVLQEALAELKAIPLKTGKPLKVALVGEIYMVLEPRVNFEIERVLGEMGVEVERTIYFTDWIREQLCLSIINPGWRNQMLQLAKPYLNNFVGGHGLETVAHTVSAGVNRLDGVIELAPFTCMPEIVAMQVLPAVSKELSIPVLSVIIDEHSAEAGIKTRLEAFVDLIAYKQKVGGKTLETVSRY